MSLIKYAIVQTATNTASMSGYYDDSVTPFNTWKAEYEAAHAGDTVIDTSSSDFPDGMGWVIASDGNTYPATSACGSFDYIKSKLFNAINTKTEDLMYSGTFTYDSKQFLKDHDKRDTLGLLLSLRGDIPDESFPIKVAAYSPAGSYISLNNKNDISSFLGPQLSAQIATQNGGVDQVITVNGYTTISQLVLYDDVRTS